MRVRSIVAGLAASAVAVSMASSVALAPAYADPAYGEPDANDLVGVGSDTTENALDNLSNGATYHGVDVPGYNAGKPGSAVLLASWSTVGSATIVPRAGAASITRPVGSGAGKALLYGAGNNPAITFARSSSALNATEVGAGLQAFPFAVDTLGVAVSGSVASHAPAKLTGAQILDIYKGNTTNWSQVGGTSGTINPYIPQSGSGTRSFFDAQLTALNGGTPITYGGNVNDTMHENTDDVLKNDPDAIAPFSVGKQQTLFPTTVKLESLDNAAGGWSAKRALYNVLRGIDLADATLGPELQDVFGEDGFICSAAARPLIQAAGFQQLATPANSGACGAATQAPTSNFTSNEPVATSTKLTAKSTRAGKADLTAQVTASTAPTGTVSFYEGSTLLKADVPLTSGQATLTVKGAAGNHTYTASFVGQGLDDPSTDDVKVFVKSAATIDETFPNKVAHRDRAKGKVTVILTGLGVAATGTVKVAEGKQTLARGKLSGGWVTLKLPKLSRGTHDLKARWAGDKHGAAASKKFTIKQK